MKKLTSQKQEKQRKFLLILPLLVLPFLTLMFWALGGGSVNKVSAQSKKKEGINMTLPDANFGKEKPLDKMSYYDNAASDSAKMERLLKNDPYYKDMTFGNEEGTDSIPPADTVFMDEPVVKYGSNYHLDPNEVKINRKLEKLDAALKQTEDGQDEENGSPSYNTAENTADIDRLEQMMHSIGQGNGTDPEMQQLDGMLERILDIQHPERVKDKLRQTSELKKGQVLAVSHASQPVAISLFGSRHPEGLPAGKIQHNGFFSFDNLIADTAGQNAIEAVVHETQVVVNGSTVKLRLLSDVFINGVFIPQNHFIYGIASLEGERLRIQVNGIQYAKSLFPIALEVYDMDGLSGLYIPGAISRDVAKQSADRSVQNIGFSSIDPSWQAQAAGAGMEAAKSLFSKKVKLIKVTVKAGYRVLLYDEKQKQSNN